MAARKLQMATRDFRRMKVVVRNQRVRVERLKRLGSANDLAQAMCVLETLETIIIRCFESVVTLARRDVALRQSQMSCTAEEHQRDGVTLSEEELVAAALELVDTGFDPIALYDAGFHNGVCAKPRASVLH